MSNMEICTCILNGYNRDLMIQAIELVRVKLGGKGILNTSEVRGYGLQKVPADLVFQFDGMHFPMGIRQGNNQAEFVGDRWRSSNWEQVQKEIVAAYKGLGVAGYFNENQFALTETLENDQGILMEGYR